MHNAAISKTAVIYFSLSPVAQAREKIFASDHDFHTNVTIAKHLRDYTCREIDHSGLPLFLFDEQNQTGTYVWRENCQRV